MTSHGPGHQRTWSITKRHRARPLAELGEEVGAVVVLKPGATATPDELRDFVKARVAVYKYPRNIRIVDALPKGPTGKILKREINLAVDQGRATAG